MRSYFPVDDPRRLSVESEREIAYEPAPIGRYNVAYGAKVLLLSERSFLSTGDMCQPSPLIYASGGNRRSEQDVQIAVAA